jgi:hypothetical protein
MTCPQKSPSDIFERVSRQKLPSTVMVDFFKGGTGKNYTVAGSSNCVFLHTITHKKQKYCNKKYTIAGTGKTKIYNNLFLSKITQRALVGIFYCVFLEKLHTGKKIT